ncbi:2828_t:CDS:2, partial [Funneliformis mosseae]
QEPYKIISKKLRDYGSKHTSRIYGGDNYAISNTESEDSRPEDEHNSDQCWQITLNDLGYFKKREITLKFVNTDSDPKSESIENDEISDIINMYSFSNALSANFARFITNM